LHPIGKRAKDAETRTRQTDFQFDEYMRFSFNHSEHPETALSVGGMCAPHLSYLTLVSPTAVFYFFTAAAFFLVARLLSSRSDRESAALNGYRRTDCWPVVLRVTSTRRF